jgi:dephospho-CoA kinase
MIERLGLRGMGAREAELRLAQQHSEEEFRKAADAVIVNDGVREQTRERVRQAWLQLRGATD